jgi:hypothetical protein
MFSELFVKKQRIDIILCIQLVLAHKKSTKSLLYDFVLF